MKLVKPKNKKVGAEAIEFMNNSSHNEAAAEQLIFEAERRGLKTQGELDDYARKHGYMKTEMDLKVLKHVKGKLKLSDKPFEDKQRRQKELADKIKSRQIMLQGTRLTKNDYMELSEQAKRGDINAKNFIKNLNV